MLVLNGAELGKDLLDDPLELLQPLNANLRHIIDNDVRVDSKFFLRFFSVFLKSKKKCSLVEKEMDLTILLNS